MHGGRIQVYIYINIRCPKTPRPPTLIHFNGIFCEWTICWLLNTFRAVLAGTPSPSHGADWRWSSQDCQPKATSHWLVNGAMRMRNVGWRIDPCAVCISIVYYPYIYIFLKNIDKYIFIYIYVYIHIFIYIYIYLYIYIFIYLYLYIYICIDRHR